MLYSLAMLSKESSKLEKIKKTELNFYKLMKLNSIRTAIEYDNLFFDVCA